MLNLFITLHLHWECAAKPVIVNSVEYHNECEGEGTQRIITAVCK